MRRLLLLMPFLLIFNNSEAQLFNVFGHDVGFIYVGPKIGGNFTKLSKWSYEGFETKNRTGYQLGVLGEFGFTSRFSFQTELTFMSRGTKVESSNGTSVNKISNIAIPLLAKYSFKMLGLKKVYVIGGAYTTIGSGNGTETYYGSISRDDYHWTKMDWGLTFGCGAEYPMEKGIIGLDLRYDLGMVDVYRQMDENEKSRFRSISASVTYKFDIVDLFFKLKKKKPDNQNVETVEGENKVKGLKVEERN